MFQTVEIKEVKIAIGRLVRSVRKRHGLTQIDLATTLSISRNTIQNLESGKNFTVDTVFKVLKELDLLDRFYKEILTVKEELKPVKSLY